MIKKILLIWMMFFSFLAGPTVFGAADSVDDQAGLLTETQIQQLNEQAARLNEEIKGEVFIVTTTSNQDDPEQYAYDYLQSKIGNDNNGAVLLMDMGQRHIFIATSGNMIDYLDDERIDSILDIVASDMQSGNYFDAGTHYIEESDKYVKAGVPGGHYRVDKETGKITRYKVLTPLEILLSLAAAALAGLGFFTIVKSKYQLKLGTYSYPYREKAIVDLQQREDRLVNSFVTTRRIPRPKSGGGGFGGGGGSTTTMSGGGTFGGGGRDF